MNATQQISREIHAAATAPVNASSILDSVIDVTIATMAVAAAARNDMPTTPAVRLNANPTEGVVMSSRRRSNFGGSAKQKLRCVGIGPSRYAFGYLGRNCETGLEGSNWYLLIDGRRSKRSFSTKRHAVNYARVTIDAGRDRPEPQVPTPGKPVVVEQPKAPAAAPAPNAAWRKKSPTGKQYRLIGHLCGKLASAGLPSAYGTVGLNCGQVSDLIDSLKKQLGQSPKAMTAGCSIGPFSGGYCLCCGLKQSR